MILLGFVCGVGVWLLRIAMMCFPTYAATFFLVTSISISFSVVLFLKSRGFFFLGIFRFLIALTLTINLPLGADVIFAIRSEVLDSQQKDTLLPLAFACILVVSTSVPFLYRFLLLKYFKNIYLCSLLLWVEAIVICGLNPTMLFTALPLPILLPRSQIKEVQSLQDVQAAEELTHKQNQYIRKIVLLLPTSLGSLEFEKFSLALTDSRFIEKKWNEIQLKSYLRKINVGNSAPLIFVLPETVFENFLEVQQFARDIAKAIEMEGVLQPKTIEVVAGFRDEGVNSAVHILKENNQELTSVKIKQLGVPMFERDFAGLSLGSENIVESKPNQFAKSIFDLKVNETYAASALDNVDICFESLRWSGFLNGFDKSNFNAQLVITNHNIFRRFKVLSWLYDFWVLQWNAGQKDLFLVGNFGKTGHYSGVFAKEPHALEGSGEFVAFVSPVLLDLSSSFR